MANAAEDTIKWVKQSVEWAESQFYATIGEIIALVLTISVATIAVFAAFGANRIARKTAKRQLRAYVVVDKSSEWERVGVGSADNSGGYNFGLKWKNCGVTPARRCQGWTSLGVFDGIIPSDFDYPDEPGPKTTEVSHIGPGQDFGAKVGGLSVPDAEFAERGKKTCLCLGLA